MSGLGVQQTHDCDKSPPVQSSVYIVSLCKVAARTIASPTVPEMLFSFNSPASSFGARSGRFWLSRRSEEAMGSVAVADVVGAFHAHIRSTGSLDERTSGISMDSGFLSLVVFASTQSHYM